jgi:hypothetical protein
MTRAGTGVLRAARTAVAVLAVLGVSAAAHQLGGGRVPGALALVLLAVLLAPPTWLALGRRLSAPALVTLLGVGQVAVHLGLAAMAPGAGSAGAPHLHDALPTGLAAGSSAAPMAPMAGAGGPMLLAHVLATLVLAVVLARAEAALWHVVSSLLPRVVAPLRRPVLLRHAAAEVAPRPAGRAPVPVGGRAPPLVLA